ncbi:MAG TPA: HD domain-containing protein [Acidobacteriota bacterium]|nr:HD domain-containing protein [Acidobacteriota bacterium]
MLEKVKEALLDLTSAVQAKKLYSKDHPKYLEIIEKAYQGIQNILKSKDEFIIGIIDEELAWESEILFDIARKTKSLLIYLKERDIEKINFNSSLEKWELEKFISFLSLPKQEDIEDIQDYLITNKIKNIRAGKIKALTDDKKTRDGYLTEKEQLRRTYQNSIDLVKESTTKILNDEEIDYLELRFNILTLTESYAGNHHELINLVDLKKKDLITFIHMLNVSIISMFFSSQLGLPSDKVVEIGISALFHDIGKIAMKKNTQMKELCLLGSKILLQHKRTLGILPTVVAFEHHLQYNKKSCLKVKYSLEPHLATKIISICDVYDTLFQKQTHKKHFPPEEIYKIMTKEKSNLFDSELIDRFFEMMGVWPLGTIVQMNDNRIGYVKKINKNEKFRPVIKIISPKNKSGILDLSKENQEIKILKSLDPFEEGKEYADLILLEQE